MAERLIIEHGTVLTMNDAGDVHFDGTVVVEGDRIVDVGPSTEVAARTTRDRARVIDASNKAVLPGLVDLHYHTALGKGWSDHLPLWESLVSFWYPLIKALDYDAAYWAALTSYAESIRCGVTTVNDMYRKLDALADA
ncbi:MAG: mtaD, partial [Acidimicrobiaceae bacterium]|nr:mtaD [Acidimicrobiaceae bacterium]